MKLLNSQKDSLYKLIIKQGFNPEDFSWDQDSTLPTLKYNHDNFYFIFILDGTSGLAKYSPGHDFAIEDYGGITSWYKFEDKFIHWLNLLKRELSAELYWERLHTTNKGIGIEQEIPNDTFTASEIESITLKINNIKEDLKKLNISEEKLLSLDAKLDHLINLTNKLNKRDWLNLLIGALATEFISLTLSPELIQSIWEIVRFHFEFWLILP